VSPEGQELGYVWFGSDPSLDWTYDGLVRFGEASVDRPTRVWQIFQRGARV